MKHKFILVFSLLIWWVVGTCQTSVETPSLVVTTLTDTVDVNDGLISLREAMQYAQAYPSLKGADSCYTITFDPSIFTEANRMIHWRGQEVINFTSGSGQLRIEGLPNVDITLDGGYDPSVSGSGSAFVQFKGTYNLFIENLTMQHFYAANAAVIEQVKGNLELNFCNFYDNKTTSKGPALKIISNNDVTVYGCNFIGNNSFEGTICADTANVVHIENSLFTNNYTSWSGAAIWTHRVSKLIFVNTTITNNSTGVVVTTGSADTYFINSTFCNNSNPFSLSNDFLNSKLFVVNSILMNNNSNIDININSDSAFNYICHSLIGKSLDTNYLALNSNNSYGDVYTGVFSNLDSNGIPVLEGDGTCHIDSTSRAAGRGVFVWHNSDYTALAYSMTPTGAKTYIIGTSGADKMITHDQIEQTILDPAGIGSYYIQVTRETPSLIVTTQQDIANPYDGLISLREAIAYATADVTTGTLKDTNGNYSITFDSTVFVSGNSTIVVDTTLFIQDSLFNTTTGKLIIQGLATDSVILDGGWDGVTESTGCNIMTIGSGNEVEISNLHFQKGRAKIYQIGIAIHNLGDLILSDCSFSNNSGLNKILSSNNKSYYSHGTIYVYSDAKLDVANCSFNNNVTAFGSAIFAEGELSVENCIFEDNIACDNAMNHSFAGGGSAILTLGKAIIRNSIFKNNKAETFGTIRFWANIRKDKEIENCVFIGNEALKGSAIYADIVWHIYNSIIKNCTFDSNFNTISTEKKGSVIYTDANTILLNNTFTNNRISGTDGILDIKYGNYTYLLNNIFTGNSNELGNADLYWENISNINFRNNIVGTYINKDNKPLDISNQENIVPSQVFCDLDSLGNAILNADGTFHIDTTSSAAGRGVFVWHNSDYSALAYSDSPNGAKTYIRDTTGADQMLMHDQIGQTILDPACIGSYYLQVTRETPSLIVTTQQDIVNPYDGLISLREAIAYATADVPTGTLKDTNGNFTITFDSTIFVTANSTIHLDTTLFVQDSLFNTTTGKLIIQGLATDSVILDGGWDGNSCSLGINILYINSGNEIDINQLHFKNGHAYGNSAGAIYNDSRLTLNACSFYNNTSLDSIAFIGNNYTNRWNIAGAIKNYTNGELNVYKCSFSKNISASGSAIYSYGTLNIEETIFDNNIGHYWVSFQSSSGGNGSAVYYNGSGQIKNSIFKNNSTTENGTVYVSYECSRIIIENCLFENNEARLGSGIYIVNFSNDSSLCVIKNNTFNFNSSSSYFDTTNGSVITSNRGLILCNNSFTNNTTNGEKGIVNLEGNNNYFLNNIITGNSNASGNADVYIANSLYDIKFLNNIIGSYVNKGSMSLDISNQENIVPSQVFSDLDSLGNAVLNADGTFHIDTTSRAAGRGVFVWHNSDYSALAYSDSPTGAKTYIIGTSGADKMITHDQIGQTILDPACIGSYYLQVTRETPSLIVTTQQDIANPYDGLISLREAIAYATADVPTGTLKDLNGNFTITFDSTIFVNDNSTIVLEDQLEVTANTFTSYNGELIIQGLPQVNVTVNGDSLYRFMTINDNNIVSLNRLIIEDCNSPEYGAIVQKESELTISECVFQNNVVRGYGGAIASFGPLYIYQTDFINNASITRYLGGGAIFKQKLSHNSNLFIDGCKFIDNTSFEGNIYLYDCDTLFIANSLFSNNTSTYQGSIVKSEKVNEIIIINSTMESNSCENTNYIINNGNANFNMINTTMSNNKGGVLLSDYTNTKTFNFINSIVVNESNLLKDLMLYGNLSILNSYYSLFGRVNLESDSTLNRFNSHVGTQIGVTMSEVFETFNAQGKPVLDADGTLHIDSLGKATSTGVFVWHNSDYSALAYSDSPTDVKTYILGTNGADQMLTHDQIGQTILDPACIGSYYLQVTRETPSLIVTTQQDIVNPLDGLISLREAIAYATADVPTGTLKDLNGNFTITFDSTIFVNGNSTIVLEDQLEVTANTFTSYNGELIIQGLSQVNVTVNGDSLYRFMTINDSNIVSLNRLIIEDCKAMVAGAIYQHHADLKISNTILRKNNSFNGNAGAIYSNGPLYIYETEFLDNHSSSLNGAAIYRNSNSNMTIDGCRFINNKASDGLLYLELTDTLFINRSQISNNLCHYSSAFLYANNVNEIIILNSTIENNHSNKDGYTLVTGKAGLKMINTTMSNNNDHGIYISNSDKTVDFINAIIVNRLNAEKDVRNYANSQMNSYFSLFGKVDNGNDTTLTVFTNHIGSQIGVTMSEVFETFDTQGKPVLDPDGTLHIDSLGKATSTGVFVWNNSDYSALAYSMTPTGAKTYIRGTTGADQMLTHDQIGQTILDPACMGSYYLQVTRETPSLIVTTQQDIVNPLDGLISLREAISYATADVPTGTLKDLNGNFTITFDSTIFVNGNSTIVLDDQLKVTANTFNSINGELIIQGLPQVNVTVSGNNLYRFIIINDDNLLSLKRLTIKECKASDGGAIYQGNSQLNISECTFQNNTSTGNGGAISSYGLLNVYQSTFMNNSSNTSSLRGGAIYKDHLSNLVLDGCEFIGNRSYEGTICSRNCDSLIITNSRFSNNTSTYQGAIMWTSQANEIIIKNTTMESNVSNRNGYCISTGKANFTLINSTMSNNVGGIEMSNDVSGASFNFINSIVVNESNPQMDIRLRRDTATINSFYSLFGTVDAYYDTTLNIFNTHIGTQIGVTMSDLFETFTAQGKPVLDADGTLHIDALSQAACSGSYFWHNNDYSTMAYSLSPTDSLHYIRGNDSFLTMLAKDQIGQTISGEAHIGSYFRGCRIIRIDDILTPMPICSGDTLVLVIPTLDDKGFAVTAQGWELAVDSLFNQSIVYTNQSLNYLQNNCYLRYYVTNINGTFYSNVVQISVLPEVTIELIDNIEICYGGNIETLSVVKTSSANISRIEIHNNDSTIGLDAYYATDTIQGTLLINEGNTPKVATLTVTPYSSKDGVECAGISDTLTVTIYPQLLLDTIQNQVLCVNSLTQEIPFSIQSSADSVRYLWSNDNTSIGLSANGEGNIPPFITVNNDTVPQRAVITVTPQTIHSDSIICTGTPFNFYLMVLPEVTVPTIANQKVCNNDLTDSIAFDTHRYSGRVHYEWTNSNSVIGLPASGTGTIPSFTAIGKDTVLQVATITVTGYYQMNNTICASQPDSFTITVLPKVTMDSLPDLILCGNEVVSTIAFTSTVDSTFMRYEWTNTNTSIGLAASGNGIIPSFVAVATDSLVNTAVITVTPIYSYNGDECRGASRLFTISVNPRPKMELVGNGIVCHNGTVASILLNTPASIGTMSYQWNNDNTAIGLASAGNGNIPAFTALNTDTTVQIATITVLAFQTLNGLTCQTDSQQFTISVNPVATMVSINNSTVCAGAIVSSIDFSSNVSSQAVRYDWHNNDTTIGLSARGSGAIPSFTATNNGQNPIIATITVTPYITTNGLDCAGNTINFTITVNPQVAMAAVTNQVLCAGSSSNAITFASTNSGGTIRYEWNNDNTSIGLAATGNGSIPSFTTVNGTTAPVTATITVTPYFTADGVECSGIAQTFTITVLPTVTMNALQNQTTCHNATINAVSFSTSLTNGTMRYAWTNSNTAIGLAASGTGDIAAFTATNTGLTALVATITITPYYTYSGVECAGAPQSFTITINPMVNTNAVLSQRLCHGANTTAIQFGSQVTDGSVRYEWTNTNTSIGLAASGNGHIASFAATNTGNAPAVANLSVTSFYTFNGSECQGTTESFTITVHPVANVTAIANQVVCNNSATAAINFTTGVTGGTMRYEWSNDNTAIGLAATGIGDIQSFTATNNGVTPEVATITVTPYYEVALVECAGTPITFTITVVPTVVIDALTSQEVCGNAMTTAIAFTSQNSGGNMRFDWTNDNTGIGLGATGTGDIPAFTATNSGDTVAIATITVTPIFILDGVECSGTSQTMTIKVNPTLTTTINDMIMQGAIYNDYGFDIKTAQYPIGIERFTQTLVASTGCDSILELHLNITPVPPFIFESITVDAFGYCAGDGSKGIYFKLSSGEAEEYRIIYGAAALAQGFVNEPYQTVPADGLLLINVPQNCLSGLYDAQLQLKHQYGLESTPESFEFKVNLSSALIYQKLDNVIAVYNTNGQFTAFQWYRDGELIIGANQEYYVEPGGLIGSYHVQVTTMSGTTAYICPTHNYGYGTNPGTYITIAPNPTTDMITVLLDDYPIGTYLHIYDMKGAVMISQLIDSPFITVSLGHLIQGVYMVGVYDPVRKIKYYEKVIKIER